MDDGAIGRAQGGRSKVASSTRFILVKCSRFSKAFNSTISCSMVWASTLKRNPWVSISAKRSLSFSYRLMMSCRSFLLRSVTSRQSRMRAVKPPL